MKPVQLPPRTGETIADRIVDQIRDDWRALRPETELESRKRLDLILKSIAAALYHCEDCSVAATRDAADARASREACEEMLDRAKGWASIAERCAEHVLKQSEGQK